MCDIESGLTWLKIFYCSEHIRNFAIVAFGAIGVFLLLSRTIAANKQASAAVNQAGQAIESNKGIEFDRKTSLITESAEHLGTGCIELKLYAVRKLELFLYDSTYGLEYQRLIIDILEEHLRDNWPYVDGLEGDVDDGKSSPRLRQNMVDILSIIPKDLAKFYKKKEVYIDLRKVDLSNCSFSKRDMHYVDIAESNLSNSYFNGSKIYKSWIINAKCVSSTFKECVLKEIFFSYSNLEHANFEESNLENIDFHSANLKGASFVNATLKDVKFTNAKIEGACFIGAKLKNIDFTGVKLENADLAGINLSRVWP